MGLEILRQSPYVGPYCAREGVVGYYIDRCITFSLTQERSAVLRKLNDVMLANKQDLGQIISLETVSS